MGLDTSTGAVRARAGIGGTPMPALQLGIGSPSATADAGVVGAEGVYRVRDARGREYIVDSVDKLPEALRGRAEHVELLSPPPAPQQSGWDTPTASAGTVHWPSFALGATTMALVVGLVLLLRRAGSPLVRLALVGAVCATIAALYFGMLRRITGQPGANGSLLASPTAMIDDARRTVERANEATRQRDKMLRDLEQEGKHLQTESSGR